MQVETANRIIHFNIFNPSLSHLKNAQVLYQVYPVTLSLMLPTS